MEINLLKQQVETATGISLKESKMDTREWDRLWPKAEADLSAPLRVNGKFMWLCNRNSASSIVQVLAADEDSLTETEAKLIGLLLAGTRESLKSHSPKRDDESRSTELGIWIEECLDRGDLNTEVPDTMALKSRLQTPMLPLLVSWENRGGQGVSFSKLYKLLRSYFGGDFLLIPIKEDWLILVSEALLTDLREESEEGADNERDLLGALCQGLYELISNEWVGGGCHLAVHELISSDHTIAKAALALRETLRIGHLFDVTEHIHLPWELQLERLISSISPEDRERFINEAGGHQGIFADEEMRMTLETFFQMDCNVSETAKRLYIHRNTLMYRIEKIKQETGLDVRSFRDAVLINLELLLYKVTKRI